MRRRDFIKVIVGSTAAFPLAARAQQPSLPVIGFLGSASLDEYALRLRAFRQGLKDAGYVEGQNVTIEYRWADDQYNRLPAMAAELVHRQVNVIVAGGGTPASMAAKAATATIPIVFATANDPVASGFVASLDKPGGNITGVTNLNVEMGPKRLELLRELLPNATTIAVLINPNSRALGDRFLQALQPAARVLGMQLRVFNASTKSDIDTVFAALAQHQASALLLCPDVFFNSQVEQFAALGIRHAVPVMAHYRPFVKAGGLLSYSSDESEYYRLVGLQTGKILRGEKPADLPVMQSTKVELTINLKTAKALGITVPLSLLGRADEVIE
jgi:putative tryptophan/tyrosine transport system substrate-binding protein